MRAAWLPPALGAWLVIAALETASGVARTLWLAPRVGEGAAQAVGIALGCLLILLVALASVPRLAARGASGRAWWAVGGVWLILMLAYEVALGRWLFGLPWDLIAAEYRPDAPMPYALAWLAAAPWCAARLRRLA